jgi:hypothetical protein
MVTTTGIATAKWKMLTVSSWHAEQTKPQVRRGKRGSFEKAR